VGDRDGSEVGKRGSEGEGVFESLNKVKRLDKMAYTQRFSLDRKRSKQWTYMVKSINFI